MFICPERVVRDERLVCFAGQVLSDDEAEALGLTGAAASPEVAAAPKEPTAAEIKAELDALGIAYDKKTKKDGLKALLAEVQAASALPDDPDAGGSGSADAGAQADQANAGPQPGQGGSDVPDDPDGAADQAGEGGDE